MNVMMDRVIMYCKVKRQYSKYFSGQCGGHPCVSDCVGGLLHWLRSHRSHEPWVICRVSLQSSLINSRLRDKILFMIRNFDFYLNFVELIIWWSWRISMQKIISYSLGMKSVKKWPTPLDSVWSMIFPVSDKLTKWVKLTIKHYFRCECNASHCCSRNYKIRHESCRHTNTFINFGSFYKLRWD